MKQNQITTVYGALKELSSLRMPVHAAYQIFAMIKTVEPHYLCGVDMEQKLIEQHGGVAGNDGRISFPNIDEAKAFQKELIDLAALDVELDMKPVRIKQSDLGDQEIRVQTMMNLDGVVVFEDA